MEVLEGEFLGDGSVRVFLEPELEILPRSLVLRGSGSAMGLRKGSGDVWREGGGVDFGKKLNARKRSDVTSCAHKVLPWIVWNTRLG